MICNKESYVLGGSVAPSIDSGFVHTADIAYDPDTKTITCTKTTGAWTSQIYSKSGYKDNIFITFKASQINKDILIGFSESPSTSAEATNVNYGIYINGGAALLRILESGTEIIPPTGHTTYAAGDEFRIEYSNNYIRYYHNGALIRIVGRNKGNSLYLDSSFYSNGSVYDFYFGPGLLGTQASVSYNANTDRSVDSNRTAAINALLAQFGIGIATATIRYASGFYHQYIFSYYGVATSVLEIVWGGQIILWYNPDPFGSGTWTKNFTK